MTDQEYALQLNKKLVGSQMFYIKTNSIITIKGVKNEEFLIIEDKNGEEKDVSIYDLRSIVNTV